MWFKTYLNELPVGQIILLSMIVLCQSILLCNGSCDDCESLLESNSRCEASCSLESLKIRQKVNARQCHWPVLIPPSNFICQGRSIRWLEPVKQAFVNGHVLAVKRVSNISECQHFCYSIQECQAAVLRADEVCEIMTTKQLTIVTANSTVLMYECCTEQSEDATCTSPVVNQRYQNCPRDNMKWYFPIHHSYINSTYLAKRSTSSVEACQRFCYSTPGCLAANFRWLRDTGECVLVSTNAPTLCKSEMNIQLLTYECCSADEMYTYLGLSVVPLTLHEKYAMDWSLVKSDLNYQFEWEKMLQNDKSSRLHFPPFALFLPDGSKQIINLHLKRVEDGWLLYGGYYELVEENTIPMNISLQFNLTLVNKHGEEIHWTSEQVVTLTSGQYSNWNSLIGMADIPWNTLTHMNIPRAQLSLHQNSIHQINGMSAVSLKCNDNYVVDWNAIKSELNYQHEWFEMLRETQHAVLEMPPFFLQSSTGSSPFIHLYFSRSGETFHLHGGVPFTSNNETPSPFNVSFNIILNITNENGDHSIWPHTVNTTLMSRTKFGFGILSSFDELPWNKLSGTKAPRATVTFF